jgi:serine/threonine protein kinase/formylglycine-generating enzyme required for sulfatase activity
MMPHPDKPSALPRTLRDDATLPLDSTVPNPPSEPQSGDAHEATTLPPNASTANNAPTEMWPQGEPPAPPTPAPLPPTQPEGGASRVKKEPQPPRASPGDTVPGYEILCELGRGGMGVVYKARQVRANRIVALKMILAGPHAGEQELARFRSEAQAVANLQHPNIIDIYEVAEHEGLPYFSLEYCAGGSLGERLNGTPLPPATAAQFTEVLARAIQLAHEQQLIHRDLKPANILLKGPASHVGALGAEAPHDAHSPLSLVTIPAASLKITDFGLAKRLNEDGRTQTGVIMGTPSYMAPEQAAGRSEDLGPAVDIYALGALLYEMLTGRPPFRAATPFDTVNQVLNEEPLPPRRFQSRIPRDLEVICLKCLQKDAKKRYPSAEALADDLRRFLNDEPIIARPVSIVERAVRWARKRPTAAALIGLSVFVVVLVVLATWLETRRIENARAAEQERLQNLRAGELVHLLFASDINSVPGILKDLENYRTWADPQLETVAQNQDAKPADRRRAFLALLDQNEIYRGHLSLMMVEDCTIPEFLVISQRMEQYKADLAEELANTLANAQQSPRSRFHAALALARYVERVDWSEAELELLVDQLLESGRDYQREIRNLLRPHAQALLKPLEERFRDPRQRTTIRVAAADALADFASDRPELLTRLACEATAEQYDAFRNVLTALPDPTPALETLKAILAEEPGNAATEAERLALGRRRASAAITLLHLGEGKEACPILAGGRDPEARTQFIHRLKDRRIRVGDLLDCLEQHNDPNVRFGLLLALGEFTPDQLAPERRKTLEARLVEWYRDDPRSSIHGACGWLLRHWGLHDAAARVDRTPLPYDRTGKREWFIDKVGDDCFTFIVFQPGTFVMGSPDSESYRLRHEKQHRVRLSRPFAVCDRELTRGQFERFVTVTGLKAIDMSEGSPTPEHPAGRMSWPEAALYCRWLTSQAGLGEEQQSYPSPDGLEKGADGLPRHWPLRLDRPGYRLPTEAEWEYACRAGTITAYSFGSDRELMGHYGRQLEMQADVDGRLRPNPRGLFDMHGNVWEWCHDWYQADWEAEATDPIGPASSKNKVVRGGGWDRSPWHCRSAYRHTPTPDYRANYNGFRIVKTLEP